MAKTKVFDYSSSNDNRMKVFFNAVKAQVDSATNEIIRESETEKKRIIKKANDKSTKRAYDDVQNTAKKSGGKYSLMANKFELEAQKDVLRHRNSLIDKLFSEIEDKISEFRKTDDYFNLLVKSLESENMSDNAVVYLMPDDMKYVEKLSKLTKAEFKPDSSIRLGGLSVLYPDESVISDKTLDTLLKEEKKHFASSGKLMLNND